MTWLDPAIIVCSNIVPSGLKLISESPHEVAFNSVIESLEICLAKLTPQKVTARSLYSFFRSYFGACTRCVWALTRYGENSSIGRLEVKFHLMKAPFVSHQQMIRESVPSIKKRCACYLIDEM